MKKLLTTVLVVCIILSLWPGSPQNASSAGTGPVFGNTSSNLANQGLAAYSAGWIYYINTNQNNAIYKKKTDGTGNTRVNSDRSWHLNVLKGWIYYFKSVGYDGDKELCDLYRMKTDGKEKQKIKLKNTLTRDSVVSVVNDWIYVLNYNDGDGLYRIKPDGSGKQYIETNRNLLVSDFTLAENGDCIYQIGPNIIKKCDFNLTNRKVLLTSKSYGVDRLICDSGYIYFYENKVLWRMSLEGTNKVQIVKNDEKYDYRLEAVSDTQIYISGSNAGGYVFFKMSKELGSMSEVPALTARDAKQLNTVANKVFYLSGMPDMKSVKLDGTYTRTLVRNLGGNLSAISGGIVYYETNDRGRRVINAVNADGTGQRAVVDVTELEIEDWIVADGHIYCIGDEWISENETTGNQIIYDIPVNTGIISKCLVTGEGIKFLYTYKKGYFYYHSSEDGSFRRISAGGKSRILVRSGINYIVGGESVIFADDCIYYVVDNNNVFSLYKMNYSDCKPIRISSCKFSIDSFNIDGNYIYYDDGRNYVKRDRKTGKTVKITSIDFWNAKLCNNSLYYTIPPQEGIYRFDLNTKKQVRITPYDAWHVIGIINNRVIFTQTGQLECI